jgi:multiple antibiotic resistance protein
MNFSFLSNFAITLFALLNPIGMLPVFISYTANERKEVQRLVALFVSLTVMALLLVFLLIGSPILQFFGVSLDSFRIAGGILLLTIGIGIVNGKSSDNKEEIVTTETNNNLTQAKSIYSQIVIPMAMPLLVGPGVIANVILYSNEASKKRDGLGIELILMIGLVSFLVFVILAAGKWLQKMIGNIGLNITQRIMGLFVAAIGVQFMVTGIINIFVNQIIPELSKIK